MTTDEILKRHGLAADDVAILSRDELMGWEKINPELERCSHALCSQNYVDHWDRWGAKFNIVAYYPDPGMYLVKRKVSKKDTMTITATMDYRFGWNNYGFVGEYKNFKLECK